MRVSAWVIYWQVLMREAEWKKRGRTRLSVGGSHAGGVILALDYQPDPGGCSGSWSVPLSWPHLEARGTVFTPPKSWSLTIISPWGGSYQFSSVQSLSRVWPFATPWIAACQASLSITNSRSSLRLTSIESVMPSSHLILCCPLLLLPPIPPSIRVFSNESTLHMRCGWSMCYDPL